MSDEKEPAPPPPAETESARIRRRWLTLGEILAVAAVLISAATFWNSWSERRGTEEREAAAEKKAVSASSQIALGGAIEANGARLKIATLRDDQAIQGQTIRFPPALGIAAAETTGDPRIEAAWLRKPLVKAMKAAGVKEPGTGERRLPVLIVTRYLAGGTMRTARGYYDVGYRLSEGGLLDGPDLTLAGLALIAEAAADDPGKRLDALWAERKPADK